MALIFGSGEPVSRLRRGLDVKGKVNLGLDEIVVPIAAVSDFTGPPYRRSPVRWWSLTSVTGVGALFTGVRLVNTTGRDQLLDRLIVRTEIDTRFTLGSGLPVAPGAGTPARTTELVSIAAAVPGDISREVPIEALGFTVTPSSIFDLLMHVPVEAARGIDLPLQIVLPATPRPDDPLQNATTLTVEIDNTDVNASFTFSGLYFDQLPLDSRT